MMITAYTAMPPSVYPSSPQSPPESLHCLSTTVLRPWRSSNTVCGSAGAGLGGSVRFEA